MNHLKLLCKIPIYYLKDQKVTGQRAFRFLNGKSSRSRDDPIQIFFYLLVFYFQSNRNNNLKNYSTNPGILPFVPYSPPPPRPSATYLHLITASIIFSGDSKTSVIV